MKRLLLLSLIALLTVPVLQAQEARVFQYLRQGLELTVGEVADQVVASAEEAGFTVLSRRPSGVPDGCSYAAEVVAMHHRVFAADVAALNPLTAPYTTIDRVVVFGDENGTHVAAVNPVSIARTVMLDRSEGTARATSHLGVIQQSMAGVSGSPGGGGYGQERDRGFIGKTMGVMAGGPFDGKIEVRATVPAADWREVADRLQTAFGSPGPEWGIQADFRLDQPDLGVAIIGVSGLRMEGKSFAIVGAGADRSRKELACPGLAHAAAYPLEVVVRQNGDSVDIETVDAMYRMKMYFEDAGKWAFMKNMGMPGSIASELGLAIEQAASGSGS